MSSNNNDNNNNTNNVWQFPEQEPNLLIGDDVPVCFEEDEPVTKRWKSSSSSSSSSQIAHQQLRINNNELPVPQAHYNPLVELSPLGLRLRKSPSLLELAQKRLNQCNTDTSYLPVENLEARNKRSLKAKNRVRASSSIDNKLKASHFPALLLRIGQWEYVSKHEGDLVAKCYFSKHKIVWEVLDGGLKKKFEINWADIVGLKANISADGLGTLAIVLDKQPLFFKEVNPQPRKHTQWRTTSDFTDGEASAHRQHFLQCAQGILDKHYEKLIQCDARINFLSQQQEIVLSYPYFPPKASINDEDTSGNSGFNLPERYGIAHMSYPPTLQISSSNIVESSSLGFIHQNMSKDAPSSSSMMSMDIDAPKDIEHLTVPCMGRTMSISDFVNQIGNSLSEQNLSGNMPFSSNAFGQNIPKEMLENISHILLSDNQLTSGASDERTLMSRVNSLCCLLHKQDGNVIVQQDGNDSSTPDSTIIPGSASQDDGSIRVSSKLPKEYPNDSSTAGSSQLVQQDGNDSSNLESNTIPENENQQDGSNQESALLRNDSFGDLVHQLPRIASLPRFLFEISENGEILK